MRAGSQESTITAHVMSSCFHATQNHQSNRSQTHTSAIIYFAKGPVYRKLLAADKTPLPYTLISFGNWPMQCGEKDSVHLLHDNARSHLASITCEKIAKMIGIRYPIHSGLLKHHLRGKKLKGMMTSKRKSIAPSSC